MQDAFADAGSGTRSPAARRYLQLDPGCLRRNVPLIGRILAGLVAAGLVYLVARPDSYTASTQVLVDRRELQIASPDTVFTTSVTNVPWVQTQAELLKSERIGAQVVSRLKLESDPEFSSRSWLGTLLRPETPPATGAPSESGDHVASPDGSRAVRALRRHVSVTRIGETFLIEVRARSSDRDKAARIANAFAQAYLDDIAAANARLAETTSAWLRDRMRSAGPMARVVSVATPPLDRDPPGTMLVLLLSLAGGLGLGIAVAFARENLDPTVRTPERLRALSGAECLGILPRAAESAFAAPRAASLEDADSEAQPEAEDGRQLLTLAVDAPGSVAARTIARAATTIDLERKLRMLGVTSPGPGDGKTVVAANLAHAIADTGRKVLLVDAAGGPGSLSERLVPGAREGLLEILRDGSGHADVVIEVASGLHLIAFGNGGQAASLAIWSLRLRKLLQAARGSYELVVVDLPALQPSPDAAAAAHVLDGMLLVAAWGATREDRIASLCAPSGPLHDKLVGTILNDVDAQVFATYPRAGEWCDAPSAAGASDGSPDPSGTPGAGMPSPVAMARKLLSLPGLPGTLSAFQQKWHTCLHTVRSFAPFWPR